MDAAAPWTMWTAGRNFEWAIRTNGRPQRPQGLDNPAARLCAPPRARGAGLPTAPTGPATREWDPAAFSLAAAERVCDADAGIVGGDLAHAGGRHAT